jgi:hypothetical protein
MVIAGDQSRERLLNDELPLDWAEQERMLGCAT